MGSRCREDLRYENFTSSLGNYVKEMYLNARRSCSTIICPHSTNRITDSWHCRYRRNVCDGKNSRVAQYDAFLGAGIRVFR